MFTGFRNTLLLFLCLFFTMSQAWAVALGKIEVTSHLGETFFAETPLLLDADEKISDVSIELAGSSDYQILEVFRDDVLSKLNVEIRSDARGSRAVISSTEAVDTPYFNLVLKMKHGHATNFKKYPVFLDLPAQVRPAAPETRIVEQAIAPEPMPANGAMPVVSALSIHPDDAGATIDPMAADAAPSRFKPYAGWARTDRYGPMVRGDTISTVALRLSVGQKYTQSQVMVGLFNKNKDKFRENNINLINAGTYLDVPSADEIEAIQDRDARRILKEHGERWKALKSEPIYAAEAEAQKNRYRTRVHVGQSASGVAAAPVQGEQTKPGAIDKKMQESDAGTDVSSQDKTAEGETAQLRALREENQRLQQALEESEARASDSLPTTADAAIAEEQVKKLELTVARLQQQLKQMDAELQEVRSQDMNTLTYALSGIIVLLIAVAGYLLFLLRRDRPHPTMDMSTAEPDSESRIEPGADDSVFEDSISDDLEHDALTESLDSDMENTDAIHSSVPQAGVDYVAEAEVYLRYGMEDEAVQQLRLGIEQKPDNLQAHSKLVEVLQGQGNQVAMAAAVEAARAVLTAEDLQAFEDSLPSTDGGADQSNESGSEIDGGEKGAESGVDLFDDLDMSGLDDSGGEKEASVEDTLLSEEQELGEEADGDALLDGDEAVAQTPSEDDDAGLDFTLDDKESEGVDLTDAHKEAATDTEQDSGDGIAFETSDESADGHEEDVSDTAIDSSAEDKALDPDTPEDEVPETVIETGSEDEGLDLDKILGEFDHMPEHSGAEAGSEDEGAADSIDITTIPDMDVSDELDGLLAEWDEDKDESSADAGPENLDMDRARSLLAEGQLDEAEKALQKALDGDRRGDALIGLAEAAAKRGDDARKNELLAEAESLVDDSNRDWFDLVKSLSS